MAILQKDCTYVLFHLDWSAFSILATFQDEEKFFNYVKEIPVDKAEDLLVSKFINNEVRPSPLIDGLSIKDYLKTHVT